MAQNNDCISVITNAIIRGTYRPFVSLTSQGHIVQVRRTECKTSILKQEITIRVNSPFLHDVLYLNNRWASFGKIKGEL